jgi:antirestriction protein ArdC
MQRPEKQDIYNRTTNQIVSYLKKRLKPWVRPWNAEHAAGRITRPLRHNGKPYSRLSCRELVIARAHRSSGAGRCSGEGRDNSICREER